MGYTSEYISTLADSLKSGIWEASLTVDLMKRSAALEDVASRIASPFVRMAYQFSGSSLDTHQDYAAFHQELLRMIKLGQANEAFALVDKILDKSNAKL